jgi:hypothetical protein
LRLVLAGLDIKRTKAAMQEDPGNKNSDTTEANLEYSKKKKE